MMCGLGRNGRAGRCLEGCRVGYVAYSTSFSGEKTSQIRDNLVALMSAKTS